MGLKVLLRSDDGGQEWTWSRRCNPSSYKLAPIQKQHPISGTLCSRSALFVTRIEATSVNQLTRPQKIKLSCSDISRFEELSWVRTSRWGVIHVSLSSQRALLQPHGNRESSASRHVLPPLDPSPLLSLLSLLTSSRTAMTTTIKGFRRLDWRVSDTRLGAYPVRASCSSTIAFTGHQLRCISQV